MNKKRWIYLVASVFVATFVAAFIGARIGQGYRASNANNLCEQSVTREGIETIIRDHSDGLGMVASYVTSNRAFLIVVEPADDPDPTIDGSTLNCSLIQEMVRTPATDSDPSPPLDLCAYFREFEHATREHPEVDREVATQDLLEEVLPQVISEEFGEEVCHQRHAFDLRLLFPEEESTIISPQGAISI